VDSTGAEIRFTQAASLAPTTAWAIFRASRRLPHVTSTILGLLVCAISVSAVSCQERVSPFHVDLDKTTLRTLR
jgi:hypothetical protein